MPSADEDDRPPPRTFGRRRGRPLRAGRDRLVEERLPELAIDLGGEGLLDPTRLFSETPEAIWLEIGFGAGEHLAWQAEHNPKVGFIGAEVFVNGVASLLRHIDEQQLDNVRIHADDARPLLERLAPGSITRIFLLFPDPWPKARHSGRRFIQSETLDRLASLLQPGGELRVASDDPGYVAWALAHLMRHPAFCWTARRPQDWRQRPDDWPQTRYEAKARQAGRQPTFLIFRRRPATNRFGAEASSPVRSADTPPP